MNVNFILENYFYVDSDTGVSLRRCNYGIIPEMHLQNKVNKKRRNS